MPKRTSKMGQHGDFDGCKDGLGTVVATIKLVNYIPFETIPIEVGKTMSCLPPMTGNGISIPPIKVMTGGWFMTSFYHVLPTKNIQLYVLLGSNYSWFVSHIIEISYQAGCCSCEPYLSSHLPTPPRKKKNVIESWLVSL